MKKKIFDRRGAGIELAILMMVVSFSMSILLTSVALIQSTKKVRAEERLQQSIALEQLGQDFLSAVLKGNVDGWITNGGHNKHYTDAHNWVEDEEKSIEATCKADGKKYSVCSICGKTKEEIIPKYEKHSYKEEIIDPKCTTQGQRIVTCEHCDYSETTDIPALGHSCRSEEIDIDGVATLVCATCKMPCEDSDRNAHDWVAQEIKDPTCEGEGTITYICSNNCAQVSKIEQIPALGHSYTEKVTKEPTCTKAGEKVITCKNCAYEEPEEISALGHSCEGKIVNEEGTEKVVCAKCNEAYTEKNPANGHSWVNNTCEVCGEIEPHYYDAYDLVVYKDGENIRVDVTITEDKNMFCEGTNQGAGSKEENIEVAENTEPAGNQVLVIHVEKVENAENEFTYKITEWTKNDRR